MKRLCCYFMAALTLLVSSACSQADLMKKLTSPEDEALAKHYVDLLRQSNFDQIERDFDPSIKSPDIRATLGKMAALIPRTTPTSIKLVGSQTFHGPGLVRSNITFEYEFPGRWLLINVATEKKNSAQTIVGFNVNQTSDSLEHANKFTLSGKSLIQYLTLLLALIVPVMTVYALVRCVRTRPLGRKWLWIIFILLGVGKFSVNWTTGQYFVQPLSVQLFGSGAFAQMYGPWILSVSLPLGALIFLLGGRRATPARTEPTIG